MTNVKTTIEYQYVKVSHDMVPDWYKIEQSENGKFYITSNNGYNGYEGNGFPKIEVAIKCARKMILNYFIDRCENNPENFK